MARAGSARWGGMEGRAGAARARLHPRGARLMARAGSARWGGMEGRAGAARARLHPRGARLMARAGSARWGGMEGCSACSSTSTRCAAGACVPGEGLNGRAGAARVVLCVAGVRIARCATPCLQALYLTPEFHDYVARHLPPHLVPFVTFVVWNEFFTIANPWSAARTMRIKEKWRPVVRAGTALRTRGVRVS